MEKHTTTNMNTSFFFLVIKINKMLKHTCGSLRLKCLWELDVDGTISVEVEVVLLSLEIIELANTISLPAMTAGRTSAGGSAGWLSIPSAVLENYVLKCELMMKTHKIVRKNGDMIDLYLVHTKRCIGGWEN